MNKVLPLKQELPNQQILKKDVIKSFSKAAESYEGAACFQSKTAYKLVQQLLQDAPQNKVESKNKILDIGSGTGFVFKYLQAHLSDTNHFLSLDISEAMLAYEKQQRSADNKNFICADAERLPLADESVEIIVSSYALQWCMDFAALSQELYRTLKPGGKLYIAIPAPETFSEIRQAWQSIDQAVHVNPFLAQGEITQALGAAGFKNCQVQKDLKVLGFNSVRAALGHIKNIGAHNINQERSKSLTGKARFKAFTQAYEKLINEEGKYPLSYQSYFITCEKA